MKSAFRLICSTGVSFLTKEERNAIAVEAVKWAEKLGFPVAVKLFSESLTHKSDVGGVQLDLRNATAVRHAWKQIHASVCANAGQQHETQQAHPLTPFIVIPGSTRDPPSTLARQVDPSSRQG